MDEQGHSLIRLREVTFGYHPAEPVLKTVSMELHRGARIAVAGPNGSGKSTLLQLCAGSLHPQEGDALLENEPLADLAPGRRARRIAVVPQFTSRDFPYSAWEMAAMGRTPYLTRWGFESDEDHFAVLRAMEETGTKDLAARPFRELSGGEQQRVILARALAQQADILLLDEPASGLDPRYQHELLGLLNDLHATLDLSVIMVTHDLNQAGQFADRCILLKEGIIAAEGAPQEVLVPATLETVYGLPFETADSSRGRRLVFPA